MAFLPGSTLPLARPRAQRIVHALSPARRRGACCAARAAVDDVDRALKRAAAVDGELGSFVTLDAQRARARAPREGPLSGRAVAVKDNLCVAGVSTTAGSRILDGFVPAYDATAVKRLEEAGAVVFGKTNMDEFGMGSSCETSAYGLTRNPWDLERVPGGSSGGSAAAVAAGICDIALGTDTGGSVRQPASFCGVTGLKPSYGRVSRHGLLAYASSLDTVGPITRTVSDAAAVLSVIAGHDPMDSTSLREPVPDYVAALAKGGDLEGLTVGVVKETVGGGVAQDVKDRVNEAVECLRSLGAEVKEVSLPRLSAATAAYYVLAPCEASANLARYDGVRYGVRDFAAPDSYQLYARSRAAGLGDEVKRRICVGTYALSSGYYDAYYLRAQRVRSLVSKDYRNAFAAGVDVLVSPVAPSTAFRIGEKMDDPISMYLDDLMTIPASLAGLPALSVPCGFDSSSMPVGLQVVGPYLDEATILRVGHAFQIATDFHAHPSPLAVKAAGFGEASVSTDSALAGVL